MEKILSISLRLNFTPNTSGCYGLIQVEISTNLKQKFWYISMRVFRRECPFDDTFMSD